MGGEEMLTVDQYAFIRTARRVYGKGIREIARDTGHSRNTVKKALRGEHEGYSARGRQPFPALGPYLATIERWLPIPGKTSTCSGGFRPLVPGQTIHAFRSKASSPVGA